MRGQLGRRRRYVEWASYGSDARLGLMVHRRPHTASSHFVLLSLGELLSNEYDIPLEVVPPFRGVPLFDTSPVSPPQSHFQG